MIRLRLLGPGELEDTGSRQLTSVLAQPKRFALLAFLAAAESSGFTTRDTLLALFWPEAGNRKARAALRNALYHLRRALGADAIPSRGDAVRLDPELVWSDLRAFRTAVAEQRPADALEVYRGELLEGLHIDGCPSFQRWLDGERRRLRQTAAKASLDAAEHQARDGPARGIVELVHRADRLAPFDEPAHRRALEILEGAGDRAGALLLQERFARRMAEELEAEPAPDTLALVAEIRGPGPGGGRETPRASEAPEVDWLDSEDRPERPDHEEASPPPEPVRRSGDSVTPRAAPHTRPASSGRRLAGGAITVVVGAATLYGASEWMATRDPPPAASESDPTGPSVVDPAAYGDFLRGMEEWDKLTVEGWLASIEYLERSIERDASYAPAHAVVSSAYTLLGFYSDMPPRILHERASEAAERAVELDPRLASGHASLALVHLAFDWDWEAADHRSREAIQMDPEDPLAMIARSFYLGWVGRHDEAIEIQRAAATQHPGSRWVNSWLVGHLFFARRYDEAIDEATRAVALSPEFRDIHLWSMYAYAKRGMLDEARELNAGLTRFLGSSGIRGWKEAWLSGLAGDDAEALHILSQVPEEQAETPTYRYLMACALAEAGEIDRAIRSLQLAFEGRSAYVSLLKVDPRMDALRGDVRFRALLEELAFPGHGPPPTG